MDVVRDPAFVRRRRLRRIAYATVAAIVVGAISVALARMEPAAPSVDRATLLVDKVRRGSFVRQVRGVGTLVPEDTRWLPATTDGRVDRIILRPGARVTADSVILELSNPQLEQEALNARLALQSAEAALENLRVQLQGERLTQRAQVAGIGSELQQAQMDLEANETLADKGLVANVVLRQKRLLVETLKGRHAIEQERLASAGDASAARIRVQQAAIDQARAVSDLQQVRLAALRVRAGFAGVLQQISVEVGQRVGPGQNLARVADPERLKAELRIPETQARDVEIGQTAQIDTRNGMVAGRVSRKDPAATSGTVTIDVTLSAALPRGAVPDLSVDGTIEIESVQNALQVGRPAFGQEHSTVALFRVEPETGIAQRVQVRVGRSAVNTMEIVSGLDEGDTVVLSDMSAWDAVDRVRLR